MPSPATSTPTSLAPAPAPSASAAISTAPARASAPSQGRPPTIEAARRIVQTLRSDVAGAPDALAAALSELAEVRHELELARAANTALRRRPSQPEGSSEPEMPRWEWPLEDLLADRDWWGTWLPRLHQLLGQWSSRVYTWGGENAAAAAGAGRGLGEPPAELAETLGPRDDRVTHETSFSGLDEGSIVSAVEPDGDDADILGGLQPTPRTRRVLQAAVDEARRRGQTFIGTEHLLLGLLAEPNGIAAQVLARLGAAQRARDELIAIMGSRGYSGAAASVADPALLEDLLHRSRVDQSARGRLMAFTLGPRGELPAEAAAEAAEDVRRADEENVEWLRSIVRTRGWPGRALVGDAGSEAAWLLAQHADHDPAFQRECLALLEAAVARGDASGRNLAYLTDRVLLKEGRPQRYGTQFVQGASGLEPQPLEDPERVDELRASVGLGSLSEYAEQIRRSQARRGSRPGY